MCKVVQGAHCRYCPSVSPKRNNRTERGGIASVPIFHQQSNFYSETDRVSFLRGEEQYIQQCIKMGQNISLGLEISESILSTLIAPKKARLTSIELPAPAIASSSPMTRSCQNGSGGRRGGFVTRRRDNDESLLAGLNTFRRKVGAKKRDFPMKNAKGIHIVFFN